jgi:NAD-dependent dihydropyrimidine dehydrogenase PreA subunit
MTYVICEPCVDVKDSACADICPCDSIRPHPTEEADDYEGVNQMFIDPETCIECGVCEPECPVEAIFFEEDVPEEWEHFIEINANYFNHKQISV